jgi:hypothetical protein
MSDSFLPEDMRPHVDSAICGRCRKPIEKGHRIVQVRISEGRGLNPKNLGETGLFISSEWEFAHVDCRDPLLKKGLLP